MKKACQVCGFRNPVGERDCAMCGAPMPPGTGTLAGALCCPAPGCVEFTVAPPARYCPLCGTALKPASCEVWGEKFVEPALEKDFVAALQGSSELLRGAVAMGLPEEEAEACLDGAFYARSGVSRGVLREWVAEHVAPLGEAGGGTAEARSESLARADELKIKRPQAELLLDTLAFGSSPPATPPRVESAARPAEEFTPSGGRPSGTRAAERARTDETSHATVDTDGTVVTRRAFRSLPFVDSSAASEDARGEDSSGASALSEGAPEEDKADSSHLKRRLVLLAALGFVGLTLIVVWFASRRAATSAVSDSTRGGVVTETPAAAVTETPPAATPEAASTPVAEATASPSPADASSNDEEPPSGQAAVLILFTNADGVSVWINGRRRGVISKGSPVSFRLAPGAQAVSATAQGLEPFEESVSLEAGERRNLFVAMRPPKGPTPLAREAARQRLRAAQTLFQMRSYDAALAQVDEGLRLDPGNEELLRLRQRIESVKRILDTPSSQPSPQQPARPRREYREPEPAETPQYQEPRRVETYEPPHLTRQVPPAYPPIARSMRVWGEVVVEVSVDETGRATHAQAVSGPALLQRAAVDGAMRSGYSPARRNGRPVGSSLRVTFRFKLD